MLPLSRRYNMAEQLLKLPYHTSIRLMDILHHLLTFPLEMMVGSLLTVKLTPMEYDI